MSFGKKLDLEVKAPNRRMVEVKARLERKILNKDECSVLWSEKRASKIQVKGSKGQAYIPTRIFLK